MIFPSDMLWQLKERCARTRWRPLRRLLILLYDAGQYLAGGHVAWASRFAGKPCLPHGTRGVFVSRHARIGRNCVIFQGVTIGSNTLPDSGNVGAPVIGDDCFLGAGATIIGGITIGDRVRVGAGCVVCESVPASSVVVGGRPRVMPRESVRNRFHTGRGGRWFYYEDGRWIEESDPAALARLAAAFPGDQRSRS